MRCRPPMSAPAARLGRQAVGGAGGGVWACVPRTRQSRRPALEPPLSRYPRARGRARLAEVQRRQGGAMPGQAQPAKARHLARRGACRRCRLSSLPMRRPRRRAGSHAPLREPRALAVGASLTLRRARISVRRPRCGARAPHPFQRRGAGTGAVSARGRRAKTHRDLPLLFDQACCEESAAWEFPESSKNRSPRAQPVGIEVAFFAPAKGNAEPRKKQHTFPGSQPASQSAVKFRLSAAGVSAKKVLPVAAAPSHSFAGGMSFTSPERCRHRQNLPTLRRR